VIPAFPMYPPAHRANVFLNLEPDEFVRCRRFLCLQLLTHRSP
jgi:hypothetical protein